MLKFNILKWLKLWKQTIQISDVHNCCCGCCWLMLLLVFPLRFSLSWKNKNHFSWIFSNFPDSVWTKFCQKLEFKNNLRINLTKWPFSSILQVPKKFQRNSRNSRNSRTGSHTDNTVSHNTIFSWFTKWWLHSIIIFGVKDVRIQENYQNSKMIKVISPTKKFSNHLTKFPDTLQPPPARPPPLQKKINSDIVRHSLKKC